MQNFDFITCVSNYILLNPHLQIARLLWSASSDKLTNLYACSSRGKKIYATLDGGSCEEIVFQHG